MLSKSIKWFVIVTASITAGLYGAAAVTAPDYGAPMFTIAIVSTLTAFAGLEIQ